MPDVGAIAGNVSAKVGSFFASIGTWLDTTHLPEQIKDVDFAGLFSNPWFLVPFIGLICYQVYKQAFRDLIIMGLLLGVWYATGTEYMQTLVVGDELQVNKVLPLLFGGAAVLGVIIYLVFGRSD
jgi:hypothetical protein